MKLVFIRSRCNCRGYRILERRECLMAYSRAQLLRWRYN